jgi:outer membrane protein assembly factor BamB
MISNPGASSSPIALANQVLYQGFMNEKIEALDAKSGKKLWEFTLPSAFRGGFAVANGALYASNGEGGGWEAEPVPYKYSVYCFTPDGQ